MSPTPIAVPVLPANVADRPAWLDDQYVKMTAEFDDLVNGDHPWQTCKQGVSAEEFNGKHHTLLKLIYTVGWRWTTRDFHHI